MSLAFLSRMIGETLNNGVVGMNFRNRHLVDGYNPRGEIAAARDKIVTKERLAAANVASPETLHVIRRGRDIPAALDFLQQRGGGFVVKPARSARGRGILLCRSIDPSGIYRLSGKHMSLEELTFHFYQILHGEYSFGRPDDAVLIEELLVPDTGWILPDLPGAPDLRIIVCLDRVLMAMARLPTEQSDGRANLHCGAVGVGIDLRNGRTRGGVFKDRPASRHPDTGVALEDQPVEDFKECLELAKACTRAFKLGYMGVDLMRDVKRGPVVLEVNARPGLGLQIANRAGLFNPELSS